MSSSGHDGGKGRLPRLVLIVVITLAGVGYFVGLGDGVPRIEDPPLTSESIDSGGSPGADRGVPEGESTVAARSYRDLALQGPVNTNPRSKLVRDLGISEVSLADSVEVDAGGKKRALAERAARRAYNGAPPTIPHDVDQMDAAACLSCHGPGLKVGSRQAALVPHLYFENCQQCHVATSALFSEVELASNSFRGLQAPTEGPRAWPGAPPLIPHSTWMREQCLSCHGPLGNPALRTSHPWRLNCLQCHGRSAALDPSDVSVSRVPRPSRMEPWAEVSFP